MPRPKKCRTIENAPEIVIYKPNDIPLSTLEHNILGFEELEAIRYADFKGMKQEEAAKIMNVSRATFGRIIEKARFTIADAFINKKAIIIKGGDFCVNSIDETESDDFLGEYIKQKKEKCKLCPKYKEFQDNNISI